MRNGVGGPEETVEAGGGEGACHALRASSERASERESRRVEEGSGLFKAKTVNEVERFL
jgi:hypothetical protein